MVSARNNKTGETEYLEAPYKVFKFGNLTYKLYRHPAVLVPSTVRAWEREYSYAGDNYSIVPYGDRHPCALELKEVYDMATDYFRAQIKRGG